jgi:hypothetical protein
MGEITFDSVQGAHAVVEISMDINDFSVKGSAALTQCLARLLQFVTSCI